MFNQLRQAVNNYKIDYTLNIKLTLFYFNLLYKLNRKKEQIKLYINIVYVIYLNKINLIIIIIISYINIVNNINYIHYHNFNIIKTHTLDSPSPLKYIYKINHN